MSNMAASEWGFFFFSTENVLCSRWVKPFLTEENEKQEKEDTHATENRKRTDDNEGKWSKQSKGMLAQHWG